MSTATEFVKVHSSNKKILPDYVSQLVDFVKAANAIIGDSSAKDIVKVDNSSTPIQIIALCDIGKSYGDYVNAFFTANSKFKPIIGLASAKEAVEDFTFIKKECPSIAFDVYSKVFSVKRNITMTDVYRDIKFDFGQFTLTFGATEVHLYPDGGNTVRNGQTHPYIINGTTKLCMGGYAEPYKSAMASMRYHTAYSLIMQCLTQYGGDMLNGSKDGPQNPIALWVGQICSVCDGQVQIDEISACGKTNRAICPTCVDTGMCTDESDKEIYHPDTLKKCSKCELKTSTVIRGICLKCREKAIAE